jgi:hypothetical protein
VTGIVELDAVLRENVGRVLWIGVDRPSDLLRFAQVEGIWIEEDVQLPDGDSASVIGATGDLDGQIALVSRAVGSVVEMALDRRRGSHKEDA